MTDHGITNLSLTTPEKIVRSYNRTPADLRPMSFQRDFTEFAAGSVLVSFGRTRVLVTASVDEDVPRWMKGTERGWVTAEYSMLPGSSPERVDREAAKGKQSGRTQEIQRLIGRSLRSVTDLRALGERQIILDCDVLQADGGTRTASICAAYVALHDACTRLVQNGSLVAVPLTTELAAISVGVIKGTPMLDLDYSEDSTAEVDMNIVMTGAGEFTELQGTAEGRTFGRSSLNELIGLAENGIKQIIAAQREVLAVPPAPRQLDPR
jgi:ribonuclease PH